MTFVKRLIFPAMILLVVLTMFWYAKEYFKSRFLARVSVQALDRAVERCDFAEVGYILEKRPDLVNTITMSGGRTTLHYAVEKCSKDTVEYLIAKGADVDAKDDGEQTALHYAAAAGRTEKLEVFFHRHPPEVARDDEVDWTEDSPEAVTGRGDYSVTLRGSCRVRRDGQASYR